MGAMFRSEEMALCQLFIQPEAAYLSVSELGETGTVQFRDVRNQTQLLEMKKKKNTKITYFQFSSQLNVELNYFQRKFVSEVRRCDEMERKLRYIEAEVRKDSVPIPDDTSEIPRAPNPREIIDLEVCKKIITSYV